MDKVFITSTVTVTALLNFVLVVYTMPVNDDGFPDNALPIERKLHIVQIPEEFTQFTKLFEIIELYNQLQLSLNIQHQENDAYITNTFHGRHGYIPVEQSSILNTHDFKKNVKMNRENYIDDGVTVIHPKIVSENIKHKDIAQYNLPRRDTSVTHDAEQKVVDDSAIVSDAGQKGIPNAEQSSVDNAEQTFVDDDENSVADNVEQKVFPDTETSSVRDGEHGVFPDDEPKTRVVLGDKESILIKEDFGHGPKPLSEIRKRRDATFNANLPDAIQNICHTPQCLQTLNQFLEWRKQNGYPDNVGVWKVGK